MKKIYVLDTNVLLSDANFINSFDENDIIIPLHVLEELDNHKNRQDDVGAFARNANRIFDKLRQNGNLSEGVLNPNGGKIKIQTIIGDYVKYLPKELNISKVDNLIIAFMLSFKKKNKKSDAILISRDINVRIKCDSLGIKSEDYKKIKITSKISDFYTGVSNVGLNIDSINLLHKEKSILIDSLDNSEKECLECLYPNEIVIIKEKSLSKFESAIDKSITTIPTIPTIPSVIARFDNVTKSLIKCNDYSNENCFGLTPKNKEQKFTLDLLLNPDIKFVTLTGPSGTGKTLLALAAGFSQHNHFGKKIYEKLVISRPIQSVGNDIGYLPGTLYEKMEPWLAPIMDNLKFLTYKNEQNKFSDKKQQQKFESKNKIGSKGQSLDPYLSLAVEKGLIEVAAISHIRGRSIPNSFIVIDEAQNLTIHELKTIITRAGEGTKIVLTGDIDQIDNVTVDPFTNGLSYAIEKFKNSNIAAHVSLIKGVRSELATEASKIL